MRMTNYVLDTAPFQQTLEQDKLAQVVGLCQANQAHVLALSFKMVMDNEESSDFHCFFIQTAIHSPVNHGVSVI
jgi:hypothetical protein